MAVTLSGLFKAYMEAAGEALSIDMMLGYPDTSRNAISLPVGAVTFQDDDYARPGTFQQRSTRLGQHQPVGRSAKGQLYLYAANERALLALVDALHDAKHDLTYVEVSTTNVTVVYGQTVRLPFDIDETQLRYVVATELTFSWFPVAEPEE